MRGRPKSRSPKTYQNKVNKMTKLYKKLAKLSKRAKDKGVKRKSYFYEKHPKFEDFLKKNPIKEALNE